MGKIIKNTHYKARASVNNNKNDEESPAMTPSWSSLPPTSSPALFLATPQSMDSGSWSPTFPSQEIFFAPNPSSLDKPIFSGSGKEPDGEALLLIPPFPIATGFPKTNVSGFETEMADTGASQEDNGLPRSMLDFFSGVPASTSSSNTLMEFMMHDLHDIMDMSLLGGCLTSMAHKNPYPCPYCDTRFSRPQDCERHVNSKHTKAKIYRCTHSDCLKAFCRSDVLKRHLRIVHPVYDSQQ